MEIIENSNDIISSFPDSVIHHIMSFLKKKEAVQTCILAKRWKNLWRTLPYLHLNLNDFRQENFSMASSQLFINFISNLLLLRDHTGLHTFQLNCEAPIKCTDQIISGWALYALRCKLRVLSLLVTKGAALQICHSVFKCMSLEDLHFGLFDTVYMINLMPRITTLPHLKRLHLDTMLLDENFVENIFSGCPSLTDLHLASCLLKIQSIHFQKLTCLTVHHCKFEVEMRLIDAPNLTEFCINGLEALTYAINITNMPSLLKAVIGYWSSQPSQGVIFPCFSDVQQLELNGFTIEAFLKTELSRCPIFCKLRILYIELNCTTGDLALTADFILKHCPKLKELVLLHGVEYCCKCATRLGNPFNETRGKKLRTILLLGPMLFDKITVLHFKYCHKGKKTLEALKLRGIWEGLALYNSEKDNLVR
ncbi:hypothetical protein LUZ61_020858 [Rhynchospora tenuis]|uniref:F-box domain-containing protein n=1 Tax=Rhynchospora tenuis TaxID=198213 RepID=A0AAD5ZE59_9POAL|nr:hypothetical protein LUZ61_020858 [Rhynchospora tenuis]